MATKRLRDRQAEATRDLIVASARELFTEQGYAGTAVEDILRRAGVAKGALYHHFNGKDGVFSAVYDEVQGEAVSAVLTTAASAGEPWEGLKAGLSAFLDACLDPGFRRIVVLDSVAVLQHETWEGGAEPAELPMLRNVLAALTASGLLPDVAPDALAHVALGGLYGAALFIARSPDPDGARRQADAVLEMLIEGFRTGSGPQQR